MILFLTALDIREAVTPEDFIKLVLEWNEGSKYAELKKFGFEEYLWDEIVDYYNYKRGNQQFKGCYC